MNYIEVKNLTKYYGKMKALDKVNLEIPQGRIIGLLGKNGAGKSTLMRSVLGFLKFEGDVSIMGKSLKEHKENVHDLVAFIPDVNSLDDRLTVEDTIEYVSAINSSWNQEMADILLAKSDLPLDKKVGKLSKGMKTKLYLLITLSLNVELLLLDEPTLGLDIIFRKEFFNTILGDFYDEHKTIVISTHQVEEVEHILQDIIFIDEGKIVLYEDIEELKSRYTNISVPDAKKAELDALKPLVVNKTLGMVHGIIEGKAEIEGATYGIPSLSDLFLAIVGGSHE